MIEKPKKSKSKLKLPKVQIKKHPGWKSNWPQNHYELKEEMGVQKECWSDTEAPTTYGNRNLKVEERCAS